MAGKFARNTIDDLAQVEEVDLETRSAAGKVTRRIIWVVVVDDQVYVRSVRGTAGRWYRDLQADRNAALYLGQVRLPVIAVPVADAETIGQVSEAFLTKYATSPHAPPMVREEVLSTTFRLDPGMNARGAAESATLRSAPEVKIYARGSIRRWRCGSRESRFS